MSPITILLILLVAATSFCQRPFYAGLRPIGYPTTVRSRELTRHRRQNLPPQLNGDKEYANRLEQMPVDQQPFWYINRQQYDELRKNPQSWPQRPSGFNDPV